MQKYTIYSDLVARSTKPTDEYSSISKNLKKVEKSLDDICNMIESGMTIAYGDFGDKKRKNENWMSQDLIGVDIDNDKTDNMYTIDDFQETCNRYDIHPIIIYKTFSHSDLHPKFRAIFKFDNKIRDIVQYKMTVESLMHIFRNSNKMKVLDNACKDPARLFNGSGIGSIVYKNFENTINPVELYKIAKTVTTDHTDRDIDRLCKSIGVDKIIDAENMIDWIEQHDYIDNIDNATLSDYLDVDISKLKSNLKSILENPTEDIDVDIDMEKNDEIGRFWCLLKKIVGTISDQNDNFFENTQKNDQNYEENISLIRSNNKIYILLCNNHTNFTKSGFFDNENDKIDGSPDYQDCYLLKQLNRGDYLHHMDLFHVACNISVLRSPENFWKKYMYLYSNKNKIDYSFNKKNILNVVLKNNYKPISCDRCPARIDGRCNNTICSCIASEFSKIKHSEIKKVVNNVEKISVEDAYNKLNTELNNIITYNNKYVYVIKAGTGVGKTSLLSTLHLKNTVIAFKTFDLISDFVKKLENPDEYYIQDNSVLDKLYPAHRYIIDKHYKTGLDSITNILFTVIDQYDNSLKKEIYEYAKSWEIMQTTTKNIICTQAFAKILKNPNIHTIIWDEDPTLSLLEQKFVKTDDLRYLINNDATDNISTLSKMSLNYADNVLINTQNNKIDYKELYSKIKRIENKIDSNLIDFFHAEYHKRVGGLVYYTSTTPLQDQYKHIILSATPMTTILDTIYGDRVVHYTLPRIEMKGKLYTYYKRSMSRSSWVREEEQNKQCINKIVKNIGINFDYFSNFKFFHEKNENNIKIGEKNYEMMCYVGDEMGYDEYYGKNIIIACTPYPSPIQIQMTSEIIGLDPMIVSNKSTRQVVYDYDIYCNKISDNKVVQSIYMDIASSSLTQLIGRARLTRSDATVLVFSKIIAEDSEIITL